MRSVLERYDVTVAKNFSKKIENKEKFIRELTHREPRLADKYIGSDD